MTEAVEIPVMSARSKVLNNWTDSWQTISKDRSISPTNETIKIGQIIDNNIVVNNTQSNGDSQPMDSVSSNDSQMVNQNQNNTIDIKIDLNDVNNWPKDVVKTESKPEVKPKRKKNGKLESNGLQRIKKAKVCQKKSQKDMKAKQVSVSLENKNQIKLFPSNMSSVINVIEDVIRRECDNDLPENFDKFIKKFIDVNTLSRKILDLEKNENKLEIKPKRRVSSKTSETNSTFKTPFSSSFQSFLSSQSFGKIKLFPSKKKSESRIHAEKAVKKSRELKSNCSNNLKKSIIKKRTIKRPLIVKNLSSQKSFMSFLVEKFPPIKEGVPFIQDRACIDFKKDFPNGISHCLDCQKDKKGANCRFFQYRTLIKKEKDLSVYGFAEPDNATQEDSKIWLPGFETPSYYVPYLDTQTAIFLLTFVGKEFCQSFTEENNIITESKSLSITWKKPVKGIRETCDICQTTIFNTHWVCPTCGYAVCIDCYKLRANKCVMSFHYRKNYDEYGWHLCNDKVKHDITQFHLALYITRTVFGLVNDILHKTRNEIGIRGTCDCGQLATICDLKQVYIPAPQLQTLYPSVPQQWFCNERLLILSDPKCIDNIRLFQINWLKGDPVMIQNVHLSLNQDLWSPNSFNKHFGKQTSNLVDCMNGNIISKRPMKEFWDGFEDISKRLLDFDTGEEMLLKLKDWPPNAEFRDMLPLWFDDLMDSLPLKEYTRYDGIRNLSSRLPNFFVRPDLGPKMYCAYGSVMHPEKGTTNLHLDMSDAINVMIYVGIAKEDDKPIDEHMKEANEALLKGGCDEAMVNRVNEWDRKVGALWHIFRAEDANKIRTLLNKVAKERNMKIELNNDPIHDQSWYLDETLMNRLKDDYGVEGFAIAQCLGDAILIPAGAPHQVRNLHSCIKVAGEFVSPENVSHCVSLTQEFRKLSKRHNNHEDKLQIKNIIYHSVKDSITSLRFSPIFPTLPNPPLLTAPPPLSSQPIADDKNETSLPPDLTPVTPDTVVEDVKPEMAFKCVEQAFIESIATTPEISTICDNIDKIDNSI